MAASDPTMAVSTPTGALQGVAAFSWDGSVWQPVGRAGPAVATPTGVLQGVAPFSWDGSAWQPVGNAQPGVATPTGVLDGVAIYTWSGSAWVPAGGQPTASTPTGALRGVAAFSWDGSAWQPAAQAGPSVATPTGVLQGVAMFNWSGSAWSPGPALPAGATLDLSFLNPGALDPRITFTRASTATYFDSTGTMQTATTNTPRWDYDPVSHALNGLLIEEARTNFVLNSGDPGNASWPKSGLTVAAPVVTSNQTLAPNGTTTGASVVFPAVTAAGNVSAVIAVSTTLSANPYSWSIWLKGSVGGEQLYLYTNQGATTFYNQRITLTTTWQRYSFTPPNLTVAAWNFSFGCDLRDAGQSSIAAQTIYAWGGQAELGGFPTSYIPTTAASVTRALDTAFLPAAPWFTSPLAFSYVVEAALVAVGAGPIFIDVDDGTINNRTQIGCNPGTATLLYFENLAGAGTASITAGTVTVGVPFKAAVSTTSGAHQCALNGTVNSAGGGSANTPPTGITTMRLGRAATATQGAQWLRRVRYWPRALSSAELQSVTT